MILVLGASGLVGQSLARVLSENDIPVLLSSRQEGLFDDRRYIRWPIPESDEWTGGEQVSCLVHLANTVMPSGQENEQKRKAFASNILTNARVIDLCITLNVPKLIWIGSSTGYGEVSTRDEASFGYGQIDAAHLGPAAVARSFETQLRALAAVQPIDVRVLRPTTIIGPSNPLIRPPLHAVTKLIWNMVCGRESVTYTPEVGRDYLFCSDMARMLLEEILYPPDAHSFEAYNVGSGESHTLTEVVDIVRSTWGFSDEFVRREISELSPAVMDLPLSKGQTRYSKRRLPFDQGISEIVASFQRAVSST